MIFLLAAYIVFLVLFIVYSALGLYHLWRYGYVGDMTKPAIVAYLILSISVIVVSFILIAFRPWPSGFTFV